MNTSFLIFMPWLQLDEAISFNHITLLPVGKTCGYSNLDNEVIRKIDFFCSSHKDIQGNCISDLTLIINKDLEVPWNIPEEQFFEIAGYAKIIFFCGISTNKYYNQISSYTNSSLFNIVGQRFSSANPESVALTIRRRDGESIVGGYNFNQIFREAPPHYQIGDKVKIDLILLTSLLKAKEDGAEVFNLLVSTLNFVALANTDSYNMTPESELILMSSAYETIFQIDSGQKALQLSIKFEELFMPFSKETVDDAITAGRNIDLSAEKGSIASWSLLKAWMYEFYKRRNYHIHSKKVHSNWGWADFEYLLLSVYAYPLIIKLLLSKENFYSLTEDDTTACHALEKLMLAQNWHQVSDKGFQNVWQQIIYDSSWD